MLISNKGESEAGEKHTGAYAHPSTLSEKKEKHVAKRGPTLVL